VHKHPSIVLVVFIYLIEKAETGSSLLLSHAVFRLGPIASDIAGDLVSIPADILRRFDDGLR